MGIPGLIHAIGPGERIALSKLAISHLERAARPIRIAVDISIWLFQVQAGRGGKNPELRTLFYRLLKFLSLPVHPLFVYDGRHKPPFKRGKAISARSYGSAPIIGLSKRLISLFKFPIHDAPGEAEAECARLQMAGVVDAVMSNDVDALMFGSTFAVMNYSKESGSGTSAATHVTCYRTDNSVQPSKAVLDRAGMILFALLSGGDYLPSGVPKCGSKLAAEIARAGFGIDLLEMFDADESELESKSSEWRDRLQYELEMNESGYFQTKHKAVRIPEDFPKRDILSFYARPIVSTDAEIDTLRSSLQNAWDQEIDTLDIRRFTAQAFDWHYRSGARKVIRALAEPLASYRLRLRRSVLAFGAPLLSETHPPIMDSIYRERRSFSTDGQCELQTDIVPIDVVGIDLMNEAPNPPIPSQETVGPDDDEENAELPIERATPATPVSSKSRVSKPYDPYVPEKVWVFETLATIGIPHVVEKWRREQAEKAEKERAPKKPRARKTGPKKKGPLDPGMKQGSILKYGTLTKPRSEMFSSKQAQLLEEALSSSAKDVPSSTAKSSQESSRSYSSMTLGISANEFADIDIDDVINQLSSSCSISQKLNSRRRPTESLRHRSVETRELKIGYCGTSCIEPLSAELETVGSEVISPVSPVWARLCRSRTSKPTQVLDSRSSSIGTMDVIGLETAMRSLALLPGTGSCHGQDEHPVKKLTSRRKAPQGGMVTRVDLYVHYPSRSQVAEMQTPTLSGNRRCLAVEQSLHTSRAGDEKRSKKCAKKTLTPTAQALKGKVPNSQSALNDPAADAKSSSSHQYDRFSTTQHIECITSLDGIWSIDDTADTETECHDSLDDDSQDQDENANENRSRKGRKKLPRVSLVDLT